MENEQKSGLSETLETGRAAAHMVKGAVKAGRAVSGAAKGAAAAGPYGAVAGALWENRRLVGKVIIAVIALLLIPVVFVVSLPAVIFGGLSDAFSSTACRVSKKQIRPLCGHPGKCVRDHCRHRRDHVRGPGGYHGTDRGRFCIFWGR